MVTKSRKNKEIIVGREVSSGKTGKLNLLMRR
jgi:hypothetical protein